MEFARATGGTRTSRVRVGAKVYFADAATPPRPVTATLSSPTEAPFIEYLAYAISVAPPLLVPMDHDRTRMSIATNARMNPKRRLELALPAFRTQRKGTVKSGPWNLR